MPVFVISVLAACLRTRIAKRKWLWMIFIALGFVQFTFNWTTGGLGVQPVSMLLFGAGFVRAGPYGPLILQLAIPVGAIVFLAKRRSLRTPVN